MDLQIDHINEKEVIIAFDKQSVVFDELYSGNSIIQYKRNRVRAHLSKYLKPGSNILELNSGTGEDAIYFAKQGHTVHATDISDGMQAVLKKKVQAASLDVQITNERCSFIGLNKLLNQGPYDCIFSNFAGLNCTGELDQVMNSFDPLLKPGGIVALVILPQFCLWESLLLFRGKFKTALRRFSGSAGRNANIDGNSFRCWYYSPRFIVNIMKDKYDLLNLEGLCTIVPPSYIEHFAEKHPRIFSFLCKSENYFKDKWPWKNIGDYYIISFRKR
jgi:ubiquinone/menaquinone biosynthesis C-methylase UbiE